MSGSLEERKDGRNEGEIGVMEGRIQFTSQQDNSYSIMIWSLTIHPPSYLTLSDQFPHQMGKKIKLECTGSFQTFETKTHSRKDMLCKNPQCTGIYTYSEHTIFTHLNLRQDKNVPHTLLNISYSFIP